MISSCRFASSRSRNRCDQSGTRHFRQPLECAKQLPPFSAKRRQFLSSRRRQAVVTPPPTRAPCFPGPANPSAPFHAVEQRVERRQCESQLAARLLLDALRELVPVQPPFGQHAEHR